MSGTPQNAKPVGKQEIIVGRILRAGVILSFTLVMIGTIVSFASSADQPTRETLELIKSHGALGEKVVESATPHFPSSLTDIFRDSLSLRGPAIVMLGIVVLVATPVVRVAASIVLFALEGDRFYVATTTLVLVLLVICLFVGRGA